MKTQLKTFKKVTKENYIYVDQDYFNSKTFLGYLWDSRTFSIYLIHNFTWN